MKYTSGGMVVDTFRSRLPSHGFATDDLRQGVRFMPLSQLIEKAIIQFNWKHSIGFLAYDLDSDTAFFDWYDNSNPPPNILVLNRSNGHAHYLYALDVPVHNYTDARQKPLRYLASIDVAMTEALHADPGYSKLLCKNPLSDEWLVTYPRQEVYDLDELASWVDLEAYKDRRRRLPAVGYGRNSRLFETLRVWAYRARRQPFLSEELFHARVLCHATSINAGFDPPLPHGEVRSTAKSVSRWTWRNMSRESFIEYQREMGRRSGQAGHARALELRQRIVDAVEQCPTLTQADIAAMMGITQQAVSWHLRKYKSTISDKGSNSAGSGEPPEGEGHD